MFVCVSLRETSVKAPHACRPSRDRTKIYFLTPTNRKTCRSLCTYAHKHANTHTQPHKTIHVHIKICYTCKHTHLVLGANYKIGDEVLCETV